MSLGLAREIKAKPGMPIWRRNEAGEPFSLKLIAAGSKAIAVDEEPESMAEPRQPLNAAPLRKEETNAGPTARPSQVGGQSTPRDGSKLALVIGLLRGADGATLGSLTQATGWLPHTTRAALTGLRRRGYSVVRSKSEAGGSVYRMADVRGDEAASVPDPAQAVAALRRASRAKRAA